jgi:penicillin-binding protein 1C
LPLLFEVVDSLPRTPGAARRAPPATVRKVEVCWPLGIAFDPEQPQLCRERREAWALADALPPTFAERGAQLWSSGRRSVRVDAGSGLRLSADCGGTHAERVVSLARWPSLSYPWLSQGERRATAIPPLSPDCREDGIAASEVLRIDGPPPDSAIARAPNSSRPPQVRLRALGTGARVRWLVNGRLVGESEGGGSFLHAFEATGDQRVTALADTGAWAELRLRVLR